MALEVQEFADPPVPQVTGTAGAQLGEGGVCPRARVHALRSIGIQQSGAKDTLVNVVTTHTHHDVITTVSLVSTHLV